MSDTKEKMTQQPIVDTAQEFEGKVERIDVKRIKSEIYPGEGQVVVIYFNSIGGRHRPECVWDGQPPEKMGQYTQKILAVIQANFKENPAFYVSVMPHSINIFAFGSPLLPIPYSEDFDYLIASLNVADMSIQPTSDKPKVACRIDRILGEVESGIWDGIPITETDPLGAYARAPRILNFDATIQAPHKIFKLLSK